MIIKNRFIRSQRIYNRTCNAAIRLVLQWTPEGKRPRGRPRKRWIDVIENDLEDLALLNWRDLVQDQDKWNGFVMVVKTLGDYLLLLLQPEEEDDYHYVRFPLFKFYVCFGASVFFLILVSALCIEQNNNILILLTVHYCKRKTIFYKTIS